MGACDLQDFTRVVSTGHYGFEVSLSMERGTDQDDFCAAMNPYYRNWPLQGAVYISNVFNHGESRFGVAVGYPFIYVETNDTAFGSTRTELVFKVFCKKPRCMSVSPICKEFIVSDYSPEISWDTWSLGDFDGSISCTRNSSIRFYSLSFWALPGINVTTGLCESGRSSTPAFLSASSPEFAAFIVGLVFTVLLLVAVAYFCAKHRHKTTSAQAQQQSALELRAPPPPRSDDTA